MCLNIQIGKINMSNFHPFEVVGRASDTQLHVGAKLNSITQGLMEK